MGKATRPLSKKLVRQDSQSMVMRPDIPRSRFTNRYMRRSVFDCSKVIPMQAIYCVPGDDFNFDIQGLIRTGAFQRPMFDGLQLDIHAFFAPHRLTWENFEAFMGQVDASDSSAPPPGTIPRVVSPVGGFAENSIFDYYGMVTTVMTDAAEQESMSALILRGYNRIINEHYRDQNLIDPLPMNLGDGPDVDTDYTLFRRAKVHDRFTSLLPWAQKFEAATLPLTGAAWVRGIGVSGPATGGAVIVTESPGVPGNYGASYLANADAVFVNSIGGNPQIYADLSSNTGISINDLRLAMAIQSLHELDARGGTRYIELNRMHFGVTSPDARLQRTEYIGGGSVPVNLSPIASTETASLGILGAAGAAAPSVRFRYTCTEHGYLHILYSVRGELTYSQGVPPDFDLETRNDMYFPSFAHLGEEAVTLRQLYATGVRTDAADDKVFGYEERYQWMRQEESRSVGKMRPNATGGLTIWSLEEVFGSPPTLGETFIGDNTPLTRVLISGQNQFFGFFLINRVAVRPMPMFGTPATLFRM